MASVNGITAQIFLPATKPIRELKPKFNFPLKGLPGLSLKSFCKSHQLTNSSFLRVNRRDFAVGSVTEDLDVIPVQSSDLTDQQDGVVAPIEREQEGEIETQVRGFANEGRLSFKGSGDFQGFSAVSSSVPSEGKEEEENVYKLIDRAINATIVLAAGTFVITKLLTIDHDYWHGWTFYEILRYAPEHNWTAYEEALKANPVLAKMCVEGKPLFEFDRARMFRSGLVGFSLHGSLSHYYYQFCEALFPFQDWWVVPAKVAFDQTAWAALWNSIYYVMLGFLRFESPANIFSELKATFWPMLTAGWKLWPFAHLVTYGVIPVEQRLLWVDCVELVWVTILSTYSNKNSESRNSDAVLESSSNSPSINPPEE
ncbi:hypothetical protein HHK36_003738 [Tetracentron sinense]|uniref:Uncharacterized protein n=1 Tax=Tetracentron sinense TaxID=13715 RepID=A0A834YAH3_TETSI|nr:hypothetical protein HHK36_031808 [Tetracentron sinense]KAF8411195.1 hypothetical protein HHK36_003738 [Tetracentron sinense]